MSAEPRRNVRRRAPVLLAVSAAIAGAALTACDFSDIPGLRLPTTPLDTTSPAPPFSPQPWLNANAATVRSVDFADADFSDLEPLREAIGEARFVLLGEQSRYDGTTFQAKTRLVRFLHEEMGFDVLVFESGVFDLRSAWERIRTGMNSTAAARASIDTVWSTSAELAPLFSYIGTRATTARPLVLAGMDPAFTGPGVGGAGEHFVRDLEAYLSAANSPLLADASWPSFRAVADRLARRVYDSTAFTASDRSAFNAGIVPLNAELNRLINVAPPGEASFWVTMALSLNAHARSVALRADGQPELASGVRDSSMANTLVWLAQSAYPGRKMVVWSTATRIMRTPNELYGVRGEAEGHGRAIFGQIARVTLGDVMYSLGFLAGSGTYGPLDPPTTLPLRPLVAPLPESWDGLFVATGKPYAFLHLRRTPSVENGWIFGRRVARALGYQQLAANWTAIYDGFFFTATMQPATRVP